MDSQIHELISEWASRSPDAIALSAPERVSLTYAGLRKQIEKVVTTLNSLGIRWSDRVAIVLQNGPVMAVAFLAVASAATCAPLNPDYREKEFEFYLSDLDAKALIIQSGMDSPALGVSEKKKIRVISLSPLPEAGVFSLTAENESAATNPVHAQPDDTALILHTSGTTSRPKMVPLTQTNILKSAHNIQESLKLTEKDCCLNIMPLFHIHGLIGALLSTISAGGNIVCTPGFYAPKFYEWMKIYQPTWYTAVPSMHQAILARFEENRGVDYSRLRLIRSSSSALPPKVMAGLEAAFNVPVLEAYGMTEASHQMACNPLPPLTRKPGSVGKATGIEMAIMDDEGNILGNGETGEIVIRGSTITRGYENNQEANAKAFTNGWFRTGDQGYLDDDNYLVIQDRLKEIINRGGEKISPREVEEVILSHPDVQQAVAFALPHPRLGEDVAAAVVLQDKSTIPEWDIQRFVAKRLAEFKVPNRVIFLEEIPKGPTGKIQRIGMAERLGITLLAENEAETKARYKASSTPLEEKLVKIWLEVLGLDRVGVDDNFFQLGGDSIQAGLITSLIGKILKKERIPIAIFLHAPTISKMAELLSREELDLPVSSLVPIQRSGSKPPFYCVHSCEGDVLFLAPLSQHLGPEQPFYALRAQGLDGNMPLTTVEEMATHYLKEIQAIQPQGPYMIGGAGAGGIVAWEMAQQLARSSKPDNVAMVVLLDTPVSKPLSSRDNRDLGFIFRRILYQFRKGDVTRVLQVNASLR
ncbi:AMP-binding protein, partial [Candidatus Bathyarchaeota archaeon]|nr:AMP-binding protein [Candidatus Bathyarchaeota archaeon]